MDRSIFKHQVISHKGASVDHMVKWLRAELSDDDWAWDMVDHRLSVTFKYSNEAIMFKLIYG